MRIPDPATLPAALAALTLILLGGCAASGPRVERWAVPAPGATWEMAQRNTGSYGKDVRYTVTRGETTWKGASAVALRNSTGTTMVADPASGKWFAMLGADGKPLVSFDPPMGWEYPLHVGRSWSGRYRMTFHQTGRTLEFDYTCKVEGFEKVTVTAGTFDAFRIECGSNAGSRETYWTGTEFGGFVKTQLRRDATSPFGAGTQETELLSRGTR